MTLIILFSELIFFFLYCFYISFNFNFDRFDSGEESEPDEHCYPPGKLRASKSIGELGVALNNNSSLSPR